MNDTSTADGTWYLSVGPSTADLRKNNELDTGASEPDHRCTLYIGDGAGLLVTGRGAVHAVDNVSFDTVSREFQFRRVGPSFWEWHCGTIVHGVYVGRFAHDPHRDQQPEKTKYQGFASGWNSTYLDTDLVPRVYEVLVGDNAHGRLRIDRMSAGSEQFTGRLRICHGPNGYGEEFEYDVEILTWDGTNLLFVKHGDTPDNFRDAVETYRAVASGRMLAGTMTSAGPHPVSKFWKGARAEVLGHGLTARPTAELTKWQQQTRAQLGLLMMGNPAPLAHTAPRKFQGPNKPRTGGTHKSRDDDPHDPRALRTYTRTKFWFSLDVPNPYGTGPIHRSFKGYLAMPFGDPMNPPETKFPAVVVLNGHGGSAWACMDPGGLYWYGDGFARRSYLVLAVNVGHRTSSEFYEGNGGYDGDGADNSPQPPICAPKMGSSDWSDDGERTWNVLQAFQWLWERPYVQQDCIFVTGLSMGGRIAAYVGALEPRLRGAVVGCATPDLDASEYGPSDSGHRCHFWDRADIREYVDTSDVLALIAPRTLVVETGVQDHTYSTMQAHPPLTPKVSVPAYFAGDKQVARRTRPAYADDPSAFVHYLHYDGHEYHVGVIAPKGVAGSVAFVRTPASSEPPAGQPWSVDWQYDPQTTSTDKVLFDFLTCPAPGQPIAVF
jgi:dienelactone hydrolase